MDFNLTDEQQMLLESVDEFCERYFTEDVAKKMYEDHGMPQEIAEAYRDAGFGLMGIPEEYGGIPMDRVTIGLMIERSARRAAACTSCIRTPCPCSTSWSSVPRLRSRRPWTITWRPAGRSLPSPSPSPAPVPTTAP